MANVWQTQYLRLSIDELGELAHYSVRNNERINLQANARECDNKHTRSFRIPTDCFSTTRATTLPTEAQLLELFVL